MAAVLTTLGFLIGSRVISDNSFLTHFANGRQVLDGAGIPRTDPYSFTAPGEPVTVQSWLASVLYAGLVEWVGEWTLRLLNGVLCALIAAGVWTVTAPARRLLPRVFLTGTVLIVGAEFWSPRPLLFGLLGLVAVMLALQERFDARWLVPVMWVWVNTHGSFPLALVLVGTVGVGQVLDRFADIDDWPGWSALSPKHLLPPVETRVFAWTVVGILAGGLNPLGPRLLWFPVHLLGRSEALEGVVEWESPAFDRPGEWALLVVVLGFLVALRQGARWRSLVPGFVFFVAGLLALRNVPVAALVLAFSAAPTLGRSSRFTLVGDSPGLVGKALVVLAGVLAVLVAGLSSVQGPLDLRAYPVEEVDWLEERELVAVDGVRLATREVVGNYLTLRYGDEARVFMDDRFDFYPQAVIDDHDVLIHGGDFAEVLDRRDVNVVLWRDEGLFADWIQDEDAWEIVHRTPAEGAAPGADENENEDTWLVACRVESELFARCAP